MVKNLARNSYQSTGVRVPVLPPNMHYGMPQVLGSLLPHVGDPDWVPGSWLGLSQPTYHLGSPKDTERCELPMKEDFPCKKKKVSYGLEMNNLQTGQYWVTSAWLLSGEWHVSYSLPWNSLNCSPPAFSHQSVDEQPALLTCHAVEQLWEDDMVGGGLPKRESVIQKCLLSTSLLLKLTRITVKDKILKWLKLLQILLVIAI